MREAVGSWRFEVRQLPPEANGASSGFYRFCGRFATMVDAGMGLFHFATGFDGLASGLLCARKR